MQNKGIKEVIKATILWIIVAFIIIAILCAISIKFGKEKFLMATNIIDMITVDNPSQEKSEPVLEPFSEDEGFVLLNPPVYGQNYANLKIDSVGVELPIFYGKTIDLLKNGIGHDNESYFPGEGGSIILMGHNYSRFLSKLPDVKIGDEIKIDTNYGNYSYKVYNSQVVDENDTYKLPITQDEEILMIYTCWPINNIGYTKDRYVVYAK